MKKSKKSLEAIHEKAVSDFDVIQTTLRDERLQCLQDRRFYSIAGAQWEGSLGAQFENKPRFESNKIHLSVIRIINEYRNNRVEVKFVDRDGTPNTEMSDVLQALYRADEQDSASSEAYNNAFEEAVGGGIGAWRLRAKYEDDEDDEDDRQRIAIEPIFDADSCVYFDLNAKRQDKSDARYCYVLTAMSKSAFEEDYPDEDTSSMHKIVKQDHFDWAKGDVVYVAEYYVVESVSEKVYTFTGQAGDIKKLSEDDLIDEEPDLAAMGYEKTSEKSVKRKKVHKYILSGAKVLEDCGIIAGKNIPIIPVYGKRMYIENVERCMGHVRLAKDAQRLKNMQLSKLGEISSLSSIEKPIFVREQVASHENIWATDNVKNYPYLTINSITDGNGNAQPMGAVGYTKAPEIPASLSMLLQVTEQDMQDMLGTQQSAEKLLPNTSGRAVELVQNRLDMQAFIYIDNFAIAMRRSGEVWLSMAKDILVEENRKMKGIDVKGANTQITLNKPAIEDGEVKYANSLQEANFDVSVAVGASSDSKRQSIFRSVTGLMQMVQDPETNQVLSSMAMMNIEGEGISDVRDFFRKKLVQLGAIKPTPDEAQQLDQMRANTPPDPQQEFLKASTQQAIAMSAKAQSEAFLSVAKSGKLQADASLASAKAEKLQAEVVSLMTSMDINQRNHFLEVIQSLKTDSQQQQQASLPQNGVIQNGQ